MTALSHPRRVAIFDQLRATPAMTFEQLRSATRLSASTLNHHLDPMQAAGLVIRRLKGPTAVFRLREAALARAVAHVAPGAEKPGRAVSARCGSAI